jgi:Protein of unknown function (DUF1569)
MQDLFDAADRKSIRDRLSGLDASSARRWGKMNPAQMCTHCSLALEMASGDRPMTQKLIGRILAPFVRSAVLGDKPFSKNSPTDPTFVVLDERDFAKERSRLEGAIDKFSARGPDAAAKETHAFFGRLSGPEWGRLMYKHLDHHLQQFGV